MKKLVILSLVVLVAACSPPAESAIEVELGEFWVSPQAETLRAGAVAITIENVGEYPHTLVVSDLSGAVIAATDPIEPGAEADLAVDLAPGKYSFTCRIVNGLDDGRLIDHYQEGMAASIKALSEST